MAITKMRGADSYVGTNANRLEFFETVPKDGIEWYETDTEILFRVVGREWKQVSLPGGGADGVDGSFTTADAKTVTVVDGLITAIVS